MKKKPAEEDYYHCFSCKYSKKRLGGPVCERPIRLRVEELKCRIRQLTFDLNRMAELLLKRDEGGFTDMSDSVEEQYDDLQLKFGMTWDMLHLGYSCPDLAVLKACNSRNQEDIARIHEQRKKAKKKNE